MQQLPNEDPPMDALTLHVLAEGSPAQLITYTGTLHGMHSNWPMHAGCAMKWATLFGRIAPPPIRLNTLSSPGHAPNSICWYCESPDYDGEIHWTV